MGKRRARRFGAVLFVGLGLGAAVLAACAADDATDPLPLGDGSAARDGGGALTLEASVTDAGPDATTVTGTLATTAAITFGGNYADASHCTYRVTLKDVRITVLIEAGELVASEIHDQMVEAIVGTCPFEAQPPSAQSFALASAVPTATGFHAEYLGASGNRPRVSLVVDFTAATGGYTAAATWHRVDIGKPFDWTVTGSVPVAP